MYISCTSPSISDGKYQKSSSRRRGSLHSAVVGAHLGPSRGPGPGRRDGYPRPAQNPQIPLDRPGPPHGQGRLSSDAGRNRTPAGTGRRRNRTPAEPDARGTGRRRNRTPAEPDAGRNRTPAEPDARGTGRAASRTGSEPDRVRNRSSSPDLAGRPRLRPTTRASPPPQVSAASPARAPRTPYRRLPAPRRRPPGR